jgi:hypothetical protein
MKALVHHGPGRKTLEDRTKPVLQEATDTTRPHHQDHDTFGNAAREQALKVILSNN